MQEKLTITADENFYVLLHKTIAVREIIKFVEELALVLIP
jgi:hypothetical protein